MEGHAGEKVLDSSFNWSIWVLVDAAIHDGLYQYQNSDSAAATTLIIIYVFLLDFAYVLDRAE